MLREVLIQAWTALLRNRLRSLLTMLGIVWGIVAVTVLIAYGTGFRETLLRSFYAFGRSAVIVWPGQTSEQAGGERAGRPVRLEIADLEAVRQDASLVSRVSLETVRWLPITYGERLSNTAVRGVYPAYGEIRNELPIEGRWLSPEDFLERRRVAFLGAKLTKQLFAGRPAVGETILIRGVRFTVVGVMDRKLQMSNYFTSDDECAWIPYTTAANMWNARYANVMVFSAINPSFEKQAIEQVRAAIARRQRFSPTDDRAMVMNGREMFRPVIDAITIGIEVLLLFVGALTLGIGGVGVMNIMLVSVEERIREVGLRRALGAKRRHIMAQFLSEALVLTLPGGVIGFVAAQTIALIVGSMPLLGPIFKDDSGKADLHLVLSMNTLLLSTAILVVVGLISGLIPALRASRLDPASALRYE